MRDFQIDFGQAPVLISEWFFNHGLRIILVLAAVFIVLKILKAAVHRVIHAFVKKAYEIRDHTAMDKREATLEAIAISALKTAVWIIAGLMIVSEVGVDTGPLLAAAGIGGLALGFGGQYLIRDLIAGVFIILEDQYRKGDVVKIGGVAGLVEDITVRRTVLRDLDGIEHTVPNGEIGITSNFTKLWSRAHLNIGVAYDTDLEKAINVLNRVGSEMAEDDMWKKDIIKPVQAVGVDDFAESAVIIKILGDTKPMRQWDVMRELRKRIKIAFDKEGIEIPFPHRVIIHKEEK